MKNVVRSALFVLSVLGAASSDAAQSQWSPAMTTVIQEANKEGKLKLSWGEGTLGGTKRMALYEQLMNKMFGSNVRIGFTPGPSMPAMGSQIATELAAGQTAVSDVYIGAESYLVPLVNRKIFQPVEWQKLLPGRITTQWSKATAKACVSSPACRARLTTRLACPKMKCRKPSKIS